MQKKTTVIVNI